jgi:hypothetical protein
MFLTRRYTRTLWAVTLAAFLFFVYHVSQTCVVLLILLISPVEPKTRTRPARLVDWLLGTVGIDAGSAGSEPRELFCRRSKA